MVHKIAALCSDFHNIIYFDHDILFNNLIPQNITKAIRFLKVQTLFL